MSLVAYIVTAQIPTQGEAREAEVTDQVQPVIEEIIVFGRNTNLIGSADTASEGSIGGADLLIRPLLKTAELLESMPGMVAVQHSGSGKANQYFLRGFNLDHGTDYSVYVDDMPWNLRSHGHGQGYLDVNGLIPESVERVDYRKGPYRSDLGDFSMAGASFIRTIDALDDSFLSVELGEHDWQRYAGGTSGALKGGTLTFIGEYTHYDGPWEEPEDLQRVALWSKYLTDTSVGQWSVTLSGYEGRWNPTEQIPERAINTSVCADEFCALDPTAEGSTSRWILTSQMIADDWSATLYGQYYDWSMQSNPTYDAQINQFDRRWTTGGQAAVNVYRSTILDLEVGGDFRYDDISKVGLDEFKAGNYVANISTNEIKEGSLGLFIEGVWHATDDLRLMAGVRGDHYDFDVAARSPGSFAGSDTDSRFSPKAAIAYTATSNLGLYANWGKGFHSDDARGVVSKTDPVPGLSPGTGYESGVRASFDDLKLTVVYWWLDLDSELIFIGDSNSVEPKGGSKRRGLELTLFWQPREWLGIDAVYTNSRARFTDNQDGSHVEGAVEESAQFGITLTREHWDASLRLRYLGPYALVSDNSERADGLTTTNLRAARHWASLTLFAEVINLLNSDRREISYYYPAYVDGLDPPGLTSDDIDCALINCRMSRVTEPRAIRAGFKYKF